MLTSLLIACTCAVGAIPDASLLDQHDLVWEQPPQRWLDGIPLANGDIGVLVWGDGQPLKLTLDKYDAWETRERRLGPEDITYAKLRQLVADGKREEAEQCLRTEYLYPDGAPRPTRLPMPRLEIDFGQPLDWQQGRLHLATATTEILANVDGAAVKINLAVHAMKNVVLIRMEGSPAQEARLRLTLDHLNDAAKETLKRWGYPPPTLTETPTSGTLHLRAPSGYEYAIAWQREVSKNSAAQQIAVAIQSTTDSAHPLEAAQQLAASAIRSASDLASHRQWWADYWKRSYLTIPDARLESLYYAEMYKLGCSSRPGKMPITLQGLWTLDGGMPPWAGDYHLDMNVQQSYWPIYTSNRLELGEPLYRTFSACLPRWKKQCKQFFGFEGIWSGCAIGPRGERIFGYSGVELWPGNAAWLAHHYWLHFLYSQDKKFLREQALPIMRQAFLTYANLLEPGEDGKLHIPLSYSPEWGEGGFGAYCQDPNIDIALIRFLAGAIVRAETVLGGPDPAGDRAREVLSQLTDFVQEHHRLLISANTPLSHSHRHFSHLMAIYPLGVLTVDGSEAERALIRNSLHEIRVMGTGQWTGWSFPWMSLIASRAGNGNMAWQMLDLYANGFITPNTFHVNGDPRKFGASMFTYEPMTLEAGFGAAAAIMEMLLQSHHGQIRVFPTIPDRWHDAYFADLRAEGAFLVTAKLTEGQVRFVRITSEVGKACAIKNPFGGAAELAVVGQGKDDSSVSSQTLNGDVLQFETTASTSYLLYPKGQKPTADDLQPTSFSRTKQDQNFYGLKRLPRF